MEQMTEQLGQAKRSLEMVSPVTLDQPTLTQLTPSKSTDVEAKLLQSKLKVTKWIELLRKTFLCQALQMLKGPTV